MAAVAEQNLLFGLLALQIGLIDQGQLVAAFQAWSRDKARDLADYLIERGDFDPDDRRAVEALVARILKKHGGRAEKSLAAIPAGRSTCESLARIGDRDIDGSVAHVASKSTLNEADADSGATVSFSLGAATSDGQRFRVLRPHAQGGLGVVFVALDTELHREVALKQIHDAHADDPISRQRFLLEAEVTGGLEHPGIVPVYGLGTFGGGRPYYAMRFVRGESLKDAIEAFHAGLRKPAPTDGARTRNGSIAASSAGSRDLELRKLLRRFLDLCNAIEYAHGRGVLHRDIKPANVILGRNGETLVVDWGLAKATGKSDPSSPERSLSPSSASGSSETLPGSALGTPSYMSPEQADGQLDRMGPRSDIYSLGATLYCLLTGEPPFTGVAVDVIPRVLRGDFRSPRSVAPSIDPALEAVCLKAMALRPEDRYGSCRALADDVERWMAGEPVTAWREPISVRARRWARRNRTAVTAAAVAVLTALVGTSAVLAVQTRANIELKGANTDLAIASAKINEANADLQAANLRERQRFDLAMEAIKLFHGEVSEDLLLKQKPFEALRTKLLRGAAEFYDKLEGLLQRQADPVSRAALGNAFHELAALTAQIGNRREALAVYQKALAIRSELASMRDADLEAKLNVARTLLEAGVLQLETGRVAPALASYREAQASQKQRVSPMRGPYRFSAAPTTDWACFSIYRASRPRRWTNMPRLPPSAASWLLRILTSWSARPIWRKPTAIPGSPCEIWDGPARR
jgi:serine/threonine-protein kinase